VNSSNGFLAILVINAIFLSWTLSAHAQTDVTAYGVNA
jgi:hypothetical protein